MLTGNTNCVVLSLNNLKFGDYADHIYPIDLEINDTTDTAVIIILSFCHACLVSRLATSGTETADLSRAPGLMGVLEMQ